MDYTAYYKLNKKYHGASRAEEVDEWGCVPRDPLVEYDEAGNEIPRYVSEDEEGDGGDDRISVDLNSDYNDGLYDDPTSEHDDDDDDEDDEDESGVPKANDHDEAVFSTVTAFAAPSWGETQPWKKAKLRKIYRDRLVVMRKNWAGGRTASISEVLGNQFFDSTKGIGKNLWKNLQKLSDITTGDVAHAQSALGRALEMTTPSRESPSGVLDSATVRCAVDLVHEDAEKARRAEIEEIKKARLKAQSAKKVARSVAKKDSGKTGRRFRGRISKPGRLPATAKQQPPPRKMDLAVRTKPKKR